MKTERKELIARLNEYASTNLAPALMAQAATMLEADEPAVPQEPVAIIRCWTKNGEGHSELVDWCCPGIESLPDGEHKLFAAPQQRTRLTEREIDLLDGMIEVQLQHAARCDAIPNRTMAEKQKGWDMERVTLLRKVRGEA